MVSHHYISVKNPNPFIASSSQAPASVTHASPSAFDPFAAVPLEVKTTTRPQPIDFDPLATSTSTSSSSSGLRGIASVPRAPISDVQLRIAPLAAPPSAAVSRTSRASSSDPFELLGVNVASYSVASPTAAALASAEAEDLFDGFEFAPAAVCSVRSTASSSSQVAARKSPPQALSREHSSDDGDGTSDDDDGGDTVARVSRSPVRNGAAPVRSPAASATAEAAAQITRVDALELMKRGSPFLKYGRFGFPHFRDFCLSHDNTKIMWFSAGKSLSDSSVRLRDVDEIRFGQATDVFERYPAPELVHSSMSLMYDNRERSLDIVAKSPFDFKIWSTALQGLVRKAKTCSDEQMAELGAWPIDVRISGSNQRSNSSDSAHSRPPTEYDHDPSSKYSSQIELEKSVRAEFADVKRRAVKYRGRSRETKVYVSEHYRRVQTLLDEVDALAQDVEKLVVNAEWRRADEVLWQAGVNLETSKNIMKAVCE